MNRQFSATFAAAFLFFSLPFSISSSPLDPVVTEGIVNAPPDAVWKAFTVGSVIEQWMVAKTEFELKVGSTWRTSYSKDSNLNDDMAIHHTILAFDPGRMLAFRTIRFPKSFPYPEITGTWVVVYFESAGPGKTRVTTRMFGFNDDEQGRSMRGFFERGNRSQLDALQKFFEAGVPQTLH